MTVRILKVETASTTTFVDLPIGMTERATAVRYSPGLHPAENRVEVSLADMKHIVMAGWFQLICEIECQALVDLYRCEVADAANRQPKDFGKEFRGCDLIFRRHNGVI